MTGKSQSLVRTVELQAVMRALPHESALRWLPRTIRIVGSCFGCELAGLITQILMIYDGILINDESHNAAGAIFRWVGNQGEAAGQLSLSNGTTRP
jgi:hypothetical protein